MLITVVCIIQLTATYNTNNLAYRFFSLKTTECHSLQSEFDTLASTLKQLTNQKEVAQKRLDDLDTQVQLLLDIVVVHNFSLQ